MKKFAVVLLVVAMVMGLTCMAHGEVSMPDGYEALTKVKAFTTEGQISGTWTLSFERDENNLYPCALDMGDGRIIMVPLTDDEVNELMYKAIVEAHAKAEEEAKKDEPDDRTFIAKAVDWVTFWN